MMLGSYEKKSLVLPSKFSSMFGKIFVLGERQEDRCFVLFSPENKEKINSPDLKFWGGVNISQNGEIIIPYQIKKQVLQRFQKGETIVFVGLGDEVEIWKKEDWDKFTKDRSQYEKILEKIVYS